MAVNLSFIGGAGWQFFDDSGNPLSGGKIYTYAAGTTTPLDTYTSRSGLIPNTNPIILDAAGRTPEEVWSTEGLLYKYVVADSNDVVIRTWDNIGGTVVPNDLALDLADTTNNAKGDALIGFRQSNASGFLTGAVGKTVNAKLQETISVKDFGAVGDGVTDDYAAVLAAFAAIQAAGGGTLVFPKGTYFINQHRIDGGPNANGISNFNLSNLTGVTIEGNGSKIQMQGGWVRTADYTIGPYTYSYQNCIGFGFSNCTNVSIRNLYINGGAATVTQVATAEGSSYGVYIGGCVHFSIENVQVEYYCADGLIIDALYPISNFKVTKFFNATNCKFNNNARQGCSIIQLRWATFVNCEFSNTGQAGTYGGHSPQAGVDVEPNYIHNGGGGIAGDESTGDITFVGCAFVNNNGFEYVGSSKDSVQHPIQFFGCSFKNTNDSNPYVVPATKITRFYACDFEDVGWYPGYTFNNDNTSEFYGCTLNWSNLYGYAILQAYANPTLVIENCNINFTGTAPRTDFLIYIQAPKTYLRKNRFFVNAALHNGVTYDVAFLLQQVNVSQENRWSTNLTTAGKLFTVSYSNAVYVNDWTENPTYLSSGTAPASQNAITAGTFYTSVTQFGYLQSTGGQYISYGTAAPVAGTWVRGSIVFNSSASSGQPAGWMCTSGGTPGTWAAMANLA